MVVGLACHHIILSKDISVVEKKHIQAIRADKGLKLKTVYYSSCKTQGAYVVPLGENGKKIPILGAGGIQSYVGLTPQFEEVYFKFMCTQASHKRGHVSKFNVYDDTPDEVIEALEDLRKDETVDVWFEDQMIERQDPKRFAEMKKTRSAENKLRVAQEVANTAEARIQTVKEESDSKISVLQKKLAEAEAKINKGKR